MVATLQVLIYFAFMFAIFGLAAWALIDLLRRPRGRVRVRGQADQGVLGRDRRCRHGGLVRLGAVPDRLPQFGLSAALPLVSAVAAIVYLVDVRPAVAPYSRKRPPSSGSSRGGW